MKKTPAVLIALLVVAVVVHVGVISQDFATLAKNGYLYDDSFYAFQIARNIATGHGPTFDGVNLTNGFQPLYVALLVPIYAFSGSDPITPIYIALVLLALCTVATTWFLYRIIRRYTGEAAALTAAALWVFCPLVLRQTANGLETALALLLVAASADYYLDRIRNRETPPRAAFVRLGLLLGFSVLARVDVALFALAILLDYLVVIRRRGLTTPGGVLRCVGTAAVVYLPWFVYGIVAVGTPLQESGAATRFLAIAYAPFFDLGPRTMIVDGPDASFVWAHVVHSLEVLKLSPMTHVVFRVFQRISFLTISAETFAVVSDVIGAMMLALSTLWLFKYVRGTRRGELNFLLLFSVLLMIAYSTWIFGVFFYTRYYYPVIFVAAIYAGMFIEDTFRWMARLSLYRRRIVAGVISLYIVAFAFMGWSRAFHSMPVYRFYDVAEWVAANTAEDAVLGIFQGGAIGYLSGRRVINLDGKVNRYARAALRDGTIGEYVAGAGIDIVMDDHGVLELFFGPWDEEENRRIEEDAFCNADNTGVPGWLGYRLPLDVSPHSNVGAASPGSQPASRSR
ncbi:MAG: glycosyltransferase family 39 protein [Candidatus Krumholzibacteriota bacterium]|nr:glycosyltransferase family 39 protein [Candidatus Krumholzibacteriota bacterium]